VHYYIIWLNDMIKKLIKYINEIEPALPQFEQEYMEAYYLSDLRQIKTVLIMTVFLHFLWMFKETFIMADSSMWLYGLLFFRAAIVIFSLLFIYFQKRKKIQILNKKFLLFIAVIIVLHQSTTLISRSYDYPFTSLTSVVLILFLYFIFPFSLPMRGGLAIAMSVFEISYIVIYKTYPAGGKFTVIVTIILTNIISIFFSSRFYSGRRKNYMDFIILKKTKEKMDRMYKTVAHDIRAPFSGLISYSDLLDSAIASGDKEKINDISVKMKELISKTYFLTENLLEWAGRENLHSSAFRSNFRIADTVNDAVELFIPIISQKEIRLKVDLDDSIFIKDDSRALQAVIRNIIHNASKFTPEKGIIRIKSKKLHKAIVIEVFNSGIPIEKHIIEGAKNRSSGIFPYNNLNQIEHGMGLGICFNLAKKNNWKFSISPHRGRGTMAHIVINPLMKEDK